MRRRSIIALFLLGLLTSAGGARADVRNFPQDIRTGEFLGIDQGIITIGKESFRLAPGAKIRDQMNRIVMPVAVSGTGKIAYNFDHNRQVWGVWILTAEEIVVLTARGYTFK